MARCNPSQVEVAFVGGGAAAGNVVADFDMRNRSSSPCWVYGYVGFQMLDREGRALPQTLRRSTESFFGRSEPPTRIMLPPGTAPLGPGGGPGHAFFNIATDDVLCGSGPVPEVVSLRIWPPEEYDALIAPARTANGGQFVSCGNLGLNPLQIRPRPVTD